MAKFIPRTTAPSTSDKNWIHTSYGGYNSCIHISGGSVLPNCVGYAWGRARELMGKDPALSRNNAENWWGHNDGYERGQTPRLGAIACWRKGSVNSASDGAGHVAVVEQINSDGSILISNSDYGGTRFYTKTLPKGYPISGRVFQGFIYLPIQFDDPTPAPTPSDSFFPAKGYWGPGDNHENVAKIAEFMVNVFPAYTDKRAAGPYFGQYLKASVEEFQRRTGNVVDGCVGPITYNTMLKYGLARYL
jgi:surface antigen